VIFAELALEYGWTFDQIANMTFDQLYLARTHGKAPKTGIRLGTGEQALINTEQVRRNWRRYIG